MQGEIKARSDIIQYCPQKLVRGARVLGERRPDNNIKHGCMFSLSSEFKNENLAHF